MLCCERVARLRPITHSVTPRHPFLNLQEGLKDAVLQQAILQRRALVNKSLRQGTGRSVQRAKFELNVVVRTPVQPSPKPLLVDHQTSTQQAGADGAYLLIGGGWLHPPCSLIGGSTRSPDPTLTPTYLYPTTPGDLSPFNFAGRLNKALSPMEGVPERR